jgi:hypothetical protein
VCLRDMHLRDPDLRKGLAIACAIASIAFSFALLLMLLGSAQAASDAGTVSSKVPTEPQVQRGSFTASSAPSPLGAEAVTQATQAVASQPDWGRWHEALQWRLKPPAKPEPEEKSQPERPQTTSPKWLRWLAEGTRFVMWLLGFAAIAAALICAWRWIKERAEVVKLKPEATFTSHVQNLDIRPESLPEDIGAHARKRWQSDEHRQALSLLYRGALSRLVHQHRVPIDAAATEDECLSTAQAQLPQTSAAFFATLVRTWQKAVYGGHLPADEHVWALCDGFKAAWATSPLASAASSTPPHRP